MDFPQIIWLATYVVRGGGGSAEIWKRDAVNVVRQNERTVSNVGNENVVANGEGV